MTKIDANPPAQARQYVSDCAGMGSESRLVSFDHVHHVFLPYFGDTVPLLPWPETTADLPSDVDYFCVHVGGQEEPQLPFAWEPVASLSVDRNRHKVPEERIVVGRIIHDTEQVASTPQMSVER